LCWRPLRRRLDTRVGPTLAAILALSAGRASPGQGAVLIAFYTLGLGVPFLLFGLAFTRALSVVRTLRRHWRAVGVTSGALLVAFGILLATGQLLDRRLRPRFGLRVSVMNDENPKPFLVTDSAYDGTAAYAPAEAQEPNPTHPTGGLRFGPATVVDPQRTEGEPLNLIDAEGNYWESGPWGFSTAQSFIHRSVDGGDQFNIVSPIELRPDAPPGGGDTDVVVDDQGFVYFVDLEGLVNLGTAVSNDDGNTWRKNALTTQDTIDDRQWFAFDNGTTGATSDNTVVLAYRQIPLGSFILSSPGSTGVADPVGGLVYEDSSSTPKVPVSNGAPCGQMLFDPVTRNLYYPCSSGDHVEITVGHVEPGERTGIEYRNVQAPASPGGGPVGDIFPAVATDTAGTLYVVWVDESDHNVYYAASTDGGQTFGPAEQVNGQPANSNVFPWAEAGSGGNLAVAWYGNATFLDSDEMPSWYNNRRAATAFKWFGYAALVRNAAGSSRRSHRSASRRSRCTTGRSATRVSAARSRAATGRWPTSWLSPSIAKGACGSSTTTRRASITARTCSRCVRRAARARSAAASTTVPYGARSAIRRATPRCRTTSRSPGPVRACRGSTSPGSS
jgi:hypothetical protein